MAYETPLKIQDIINNIDRGIYVLPSIQREFVWSVDQIETLFDSLMQEYPIGSFLFWKVDKENYSEYEFYQFIKDFHEKNNRHNPKANLAGTSDMTAVLDGQQRLTSIYLGLKGTYSYKLRYKQWKSEDAFPKRKLYLNLFNPASDFDRKYDFRFLTKKEAVNDLQSNKNIYWFEVGKILEMKEINHVMDYLTDNIMLNDEISKEQRKFAQGALYQLYKVIQDKDTISYYLEKSQDLDKVLNIFIRVNSGGTILSYSDLLLSIASAQWQTYDARAEITEFVDSINHIGSSFNFNKDFVLKSSLILSDFNNIAFKVDNFNKTNMLNIEANWETIKLAIQMAVELVASFGYSRDTLKSSNAVIPIAYYLMRIGLPKNYVESSKTQNDRTAIKKWLNRSLIKRVFSGQPDNVLRPLRKLINEDSQNGFPLDKIIDYFKGTNKTISFTEDDINENLLQLQYNDADTLSALMLIYPSYDFSKSVHVDHIYPKSLFASSKILQNRGVPADQVENYMKYVNGIGNLQLLYQLPNIEKQNKEFDKWFEEHFRSEQDKNQYRSLNYIPNVNCAFLDFQIFYNERLKLIKDAFISAIK